ncbi:MAG: AAA family ATPase [Candidatus Omnitrophica bacterium]|nr:AAA family ATPase [Candidatus Omnitrophota bacterium]
MKKAENINSEDHFEFLKKLIELEEADEIERFRDEFTHRTPEERERAGKALLRLNAVEFHFNPAGHRLVTFQYVDRRPFPLYSPDTGDVVTVSRNTGEFFDLPIGTVYEKRREEIIVAFNRDLPEWVDENGIYHLNIAGNRSTYKKIFDTLRLVRTAKDSRLAQLRDISLGLKKAEESDLTVPEIDKIPFFNAHLNPFQKEAVKMAMEARDVALVHGPPGTGKTTVLVEIIRQEVALGHSVFVTAPSNAACDHLLACLVAAGVAVFRLGHPARIMKHLREYTLDFKLAKHPYAEAVDEYESELRALYKKRDRRSERVWIEKEEWGQIAEEAKMLKSQIRELESTILKQVLADTPVIIGTHTSALDPVIRGRKFDLVVMDEATQSTEPSSWIPMLIAQKAILAGDHFQLPPTILSQKAAEMGLAVTLFERLHKILPKKFKTLLRVQYRMHEKIMNFSSKEFYGGDLIADESVRLHTLSDVKHVKRCPVTEEVVIFLDTAGRGFLEHGSQSRFNVEESDLVVLELAKLLEAGVRPEDIAVISPYSAQVRLLADQVNNPNIEVDSVDSFQGREKEVVIVSLVRSNLEGELGFLNDTRRMNVAMTRARRKLFVIGDSATLASIPFYADFLKYAETIGAYRSSWEGV